MTVVPSVLRYLPIELATLRLHTAKSFDLFLRVGENKYVLYLSRDNALSEQQLADLAKKKINRLYISSEEEDDYNRYIQEHLPDIVRDAAIPVETKSRVVYHASSSVVQDVFREPRAENIQRSKEVITSTVSLILSDDTAARKLMQLTSHDYYTYTHSVNVCVFAVALSKEVFPSMSDDDLHLVGAGLALHDVGKSLIPLDVLNKEGPLDDDEWTLMRTHPEKGARILEETGHMTDVARVITLQHHERSDGSGYPARLKGNQIHDLARVCAIADVFDALSTNRSYREAMPWFDALNLMKSEMAHHFPAEYFEKFVLLLGQHP